MATLVKIHRTGYGMKEANIVKWFKKGGGWVEKGEPLVSVKTERANIHIEAPSTGILRKILVILVGERWRSSGRYCPYCSKPPGKHQQSPFGLGG